MADPLSVSCPDCLARKKQGCTYLWPKDSSGEVLVPRSWHGASVRARLERAGSPTKRPHNTRYNKAWLKEQVARRKARDAEYAEKVALGADREAVLRANAEAVLNEQSQLIAWLTQHATILIGADNG